jgi:hypothetical protein
MALSRGVKTKMTTTAAANPLRLYQRVAADIGQAIADGRTSRASAWPPSATWPRRSASAVPPSAAR